LGLDVGSTGCKAVLFSEDGQPLGQAYREYPELHPNPGWIELSPDTVWEGVQAVIGEAASAQDGDPVRALSVSTLGETVTPFSRDGRFLYNSITSPDSRCVEEAKSWHETLGAERVFQITGMPLHPSFTLNKIMWMRRHKPEVHGETWKYLIWEDAVFLLLGLEPTIDHSLAGRTMAFNITDLDWSPEMLGAAGLGSDLFARPVPSGTVVGEVPGAMADELGLPSGVVCVAGGHDQPMNALGAGVVTEGLAVDGMGTVECITVAFDQPVLTDEMRRSNYCVYPHVKGGMYVTLAFNYTSGAVLRWYRDNFAAAERQEAATTGRDVYDLILDDLPEEPTGLLFVPYFAGSGTPHLDPLARGALLGLGLDCDAKTVVKGLIEGMCYDLALNIETLATAGVQVERLRATGGGSRSPAWLQMKADVTGREVVTLDVSEGGCLAGAMLAGVATGAYGSLDEAASALVREVRVFEPDARRHAAYAEHYQRYVQVWPRIAELVRVG
jgi:xylulokinase